MEEKVIKKIKTACPFPLLVYNSSVKYNEVRKASGISFIILNLLLKTGGSRETISDTLLKFGVPTDLHYIFGKEIAGLISTEILQADYPSQYFVNPKYFSEIRINELAITEKGKKLFKEGAIPTGEEKVKVKDIYFSPVTRKYDIAMSVPFSPLATSFLGEEFVDRIDIDISGMEDYINANTTKIGLKTEERVVSYSTEEPKRMQVRKEEGMTIVISADGVDFQFDTSDETAFFNKYYNSALMTEMMLLKEKYKFVNATKDIIEVAKANLLELGDIENIYIPVDISKQLSRPCAIFCAKNTEIYERNDNTIILESDVANALLVNIDEHCDFALFDRSGIKYYSMLYASMPCKNFGDTFSMHLLIEKVTPKEKFEEVLIALFKHYNRENYSENNEKIILYIAQALNSTELLKDYSLSQIDKLNSIDDKVGLIQKINAIFSKDANWNGIYKEILSDLYTESLKEIKIDNMIYKNTVLNSVKDDLSISDKQYIIDFVGQVIDTEDKELIYQALESVGFSTSLILSVINVIEPYMEKVLDNAIITTDTELANKFNNVEINLWKLNDMLGIESVSNYTIKDDFDIDNFFNAYATLTNSVKEIEKYKQYAVRSYEELGGYIKIYEPIHEVLAIERTSSSHPENITRKYVDEQIARGKYKDAICDLLVKLQYDLRNMFNNNMMAANELIDEALNQKIINGKECHELHQLRMCRNGFQHPERSQIKFDKEIINTWKELVFSIGEENK